MNTTHVTMVQKKNKKNNTHLPGITVVKDMEDISKDPFIVKKNEEATEFLKKHPIPNEFLNRNK